MKIADCRLPGARTAQIVLTSFILLLVASFHTGCESKIKPPVTGSSIGQEVAAHESWNATITFTDSGRVSAIVRAGHIAMYSTSGYTILDEGVRVDFYDDGENHTSVLTSDSGRVNDRTEDLEAYGNVKVLSDSGTMLKTTKLFWTNATLRIHTPAFVEITSPTEHIQGYGLESDQFLKNYRIFRVTGTAKTVE